MPRRIMWKKDHKTLSPYFFDCNISLVFNCALCGFLKVMIWNPDWTFVLAITILWMWASNVKCFWDADIWLKEIFISLDQIINWAQNGQRATGHFISFTEIPAFLHHFPLLNEAAMQILRYAIIIFHLSLLLAKTLKRMQSAFQFT